MVEVMATILVVVEIKGWNSIISLSNAWSTWQFSLSETLHYLKHSLGYLGTHLGSRQKTKSYWDLRAPQNHQVDDDYDPRVPVGAGHSGPRHPQEGHDGGGDALEHAVHGFCLHPLCATLCCWKWKQKRGRYRIKWTMNIGGMPLLLLLTCEVTSLYHTWNATWMCVSPGPTGDRWWSRGEPLAGTYA